MLRSATREGIMGRTNGGARVDVVGVQVAVLDLSK